MDEQIMVGLRVQYSPLVLCIIYCKNPSQCTMDAGWHVRFTAELLGQNVSDHSGF